MSEERKKVTLRTLFSRMEEGVPITMLTCYDYPTACFMEEARIDMLLPVRAEFWYMPRPRIELGLAARVSGSQYHGDPDRYGVGDPQLRYSVGTVGPSVRLHLMKGISATVDGGVTVRRRFEFLDGDDKAHSLDLENSPFVKVGLQIGL